MSRSYRRLCVVLILLAGGIAASCSERPATEPQPVVTIERAEHLFELTCRESAQFFAVDPERAASHLPDGYAVFLTSASTPDATRILPEGRAVFIMIYQECSNAVFDGEALAPVKMLHAWIRIEGPQEVLEIPGTKVTAPTYYWYMLDDQTTHPGLRSAFRKAGLTSSAVEEITLGHDLDGVRTGGVVEQDRPGSEADIGYEFVEQNRPSEQVPIGINHRLFHEHCRKDGRCTLMKALDSGFIVPFGSGSPVTVTAHPQSLVARLWDTTTMQGVATQFEHMEFRVRIRSGIPLDGAEDPAG